LDEAIWEAALAEGKTIGLEDSIEYALTVEKPSPPASSAPKQPSNDQPSAVLTRREREVAALVTQGMSNRQIAQELFLSEHTVKRHISKILRKLGLASRAEVAAWATEGLPLTPPFE
jgi:non-specific serine/threonine protein kinase